MSHSNTLHRVRPKSKQSRRLLVPSNQLQNQRQVRTASRCKCKHKGNVHSPLSNITSDPPRRAHSTGPSPTAPRTRCLTQPESLAVGTLPPSADRPRAAVRTVATTATRQNPHELMRGKSRLRKQDGPRDFRVSAGIAKARGVSIPLSSSPQKFPREKP